MPSLQSRRINGISASLRQLISVLLIGSLLIVSGACGAQTVSAAKIRLHLPVNSTQYPDQIDEIRADFRRMGLRNITIETVDYGHNFQQGLRAGRVGIYFAPPHFAAWAIDHHDFLPLVHLSDPLAYVIAVERNRPTIFEVSDLAGRRICTRKPLNIDYLLVNKILENSVVAPEIEVVDQVSEQMQSDSPACEAFSVSRHIFDQFEKLDPDRFIKLYQTENYPNYGLISHPEVDGSDLKKIQDYFMLDRTQLMLAPILKEFANSHRLVRSSVEHYPKGYWQDLAPYWQAERQRN